jgi:23S rRNA pseudouridine1911/1915/1917 synthase
LKQYRTQEKTNKPVLEFTVKEQAQLMDFLIQNIPNKSRNNIKSLLAFKEVFVDGIMTTKFDYPLQAGQIVSINTSKSRTSKPPELLEIIFEDDDIIVINKPSGLLSIATESEKQQTAYHMLTDYVKQANQKNRVFAVHRLDRDTSGVLMVAKNEKMKLALQDNWANLVKERAYVAVVEGILEKKSDTIKSWLKETKTMLMYSTPKSSGGLEAITNYNVIKENKNYSLLEVSLKTGRKNQIRVHMKDIGHSVVGDKKYDGKSDPLKRLGLHANRLVVVHPFTKEVMRFEAALPKCFNGLFQK